jgi:hypothetical protein
MKESLNSNGETGHDCYEKKTKTVMMNIAIVTSFTITVQTLFSQQS